MTVKNETMGSFAGNVTSQPGHNDARVKGVIFAALPLWLGLLLFLGSRGAFVGKPGSPPLPIFLGLAIPLALFFSAYARWGAFRSFILGADLRFVTAMQAWRWAGLHFLYLQGVLPALFAIPAGVGDMAIGITAPWILLRLLRNPNFAASRRFVIWNLLGIFDFVVAFSLAVLSSGLFPRMTPLLGNLTTAPMAHLPLLLTPVFIVPCFTMLHSTALLQSRHLLRP